MKLHGSCDWDGADGFNRMVLGGGKRKQIEREPLLKWYGTLFRDALMEPRSRLLAIGYGFGDAHINEVLIDAIKNAYLELSILTPQPPKDFSRELVRSVKGGSPIWRGVTNYFQPSLSAMFKSQDQTEPEWERLKAVFFGS